MATFWDIAVGSVSNYYCFNGKYYIQKKGTAIGTNFVPVFATLVLGYLEEKLYSKIETLKRLPLLKFINIRFTFRFIF